MIREKAGRGRRGAGSSVTEDEGSVFHRCMSSSLYPKKARRLSASHVQRLVNVFCTSLSFSAGSRASP